VIEEMSEIRLIPFDNNYRNDFFLLNKEWIEEYWELENSDKKDLLYPEIISQGGGEIFLVLEKNTVIGTCAMIKISSKSYELAKMTISKKYRGRGYSKLLMKASINFAINQKAEKIILISNRKLVIARQLYDKFGFKEVVLDSDKYSRGDVKMELNLQEQIL
jgi:N-acetylglutamate synthase-like GNAT family acetyltransferase